MSIVAGMRYSAEQKETVDAEFHCRSCGHRAWARVSSTGYGSGSSPYFLDNKGAQTRAAEEASRDALAVAHQALEGVPCPRCGKSKPGGVDAFSIFTVLSPAALVGALGLLIGGPEVAAVCAGAGGVLGLALLFGHHWRAGQAGKGIQFFVGEPPDRPYVGKRCAICKRQIVIADDGTRCQACGAPFHHGNCEREHQATHAPSDAAAPPGAA